MNDEAVIEWAREHRSDQFTKAMEEQATKRTTDGYVALARDYLTNLDEVDPDAILEADLADGLEARREGDKIILRAATGQTFDWKTAVRAGIVTVK